MVKDNVKNDNSGTSNDSEFKKPDKNASFLSDAVKTELPKVAALAAEWIINRVPRGTALDKILEKFQDYWGTVSAAAVLLLMHFTNLPDVADDVISNLRYEVIKCIKERYKPGVNPNEVKVSGFAKTGRPLVKDLIGLLHDESLKKFLTLVNGLEKEQRDILLNTSLGLDKRESINVMVHVSQLEPDPFKIWIDCVAQKPEPKPEPKHFEEPKIVKTLKKEFIDFKKDSKKVFSNKSWLEELAEEIKNKS